MRLVLVGLPGSGKTTVARHIADKLYLPLFDTDSLLIEKTGVSISAIFEFEGEEGFRARETRLLKELLLIHGETVSALNRNHGSHAIIATGGGVVIKPENRLLLQQLGRIVYLHTRPELIASRLLQDKNRPLVRAAKNIPEFVKNMYATRDPLYREVADEVIDCHGGALSEVLKKIIPFFKT